MKHILVFLFTAFWIADASAQQGVAVGPVAPCSAFGTASGNCLQGAGALGSPSSIGTLPAFTLGGTISGGGNQINNVIIGASTPLAGAFTTLSTTGLASLVNNGAGGNVFNATSTDIGQTYFQVVNSSTGGHTWQLAVSGQNQTDPGSFYFYDTTAGAYRFAISASGGLMVGATAVPGATAGSITASSFLKATTTLTVGAMASDTATADNTVCITSAGLTLKGSGTLGICLGTSGAQFKTAFSPMTGGVDDIARLKFQNYRYREGYGDGGARMQYGLTAREVETVIPDLVRHDASGEAINFDSGALLFIGLRAIQQLKVDNDNLRADIQKLKRRLK